jgi:amino-acid N-acetyltransferase
MEEKSIFRDAEQADWPAIEALLQSAALPLDGARECLANFIVGEADGALCCVAGFEHYGRHGLLRSVAVSESMRGRGMGERLLDAIKHRANSHHICNLYLLTTTASHFFASRGFTRIERIEVPVAVHASIEFKGICPASATAMVAYLS